jgi:ubiquinone biosynthesis protein COQ9
MENDTIDAKKVGLLSAVLEEAMFDGFGYASLRNGAKKTGLSQGELALIAPDGALSIIDYWFSLADEAMVSAVSAQTSFKIREKATFAIRTRLEYFAQNKEALRKAIIHLSLPQNAKRGLEIGYRFADKAWRAFGDKSTDFNYYSKRTILLGVDMATVTFFLGDDSPNHNDSWAFLDRRIENIMQFEKAKAQFRKLTDNLPNPIPFLSKLRFGARPLP